MTNFQAARKNMVDCQIHTNSVINEKILSAFSTIPREIFVAPAKAQTAYTDECVEINKERLILPPMVHARLLEAIAPQPHEVALDIGGGSGYAAAILSSMVSTVIALENKQTTIDKAMKLLNSIDICNVAYEKGKLPEGLPQHAPYNIIMINAAVSEVPDAIIQQLDANGRIGAVIQRDENTLGHAVIIEKTKDGHISKRTLFEISVPYLQGFEPKETFAFA